MKLTDFKLGDKPKIKVQIGFSNEYAWCNDHLKHVCLWLTNNESSPFYKQPVWLAKATGLRSVYIAQDFSQFFRGKRDWEWNHQFRMIRTSYLKRIIAGYISIRGGRMNKTGRWYGREIYVPDEPKPLPVPPFYHGSVAVTDGGLRMAIKRIDEYRPRALRGDKARLTNPFNRR